MKTTGGQLSCHPADGGGPQVILPGTVEGPSPEFASEAQVLDAGWDGTVALVDLFTRARTRISRSDGDMIVAIHPLPEVRGWLLLHAPRATADDQEPGPAYFSRWSADVLGGEPAPVSHGLRFLRASALHPTGEMLAVANGAPPNELALLDARSPRIYRTRKIQPGGSGSALCWSGDGRELAVVERDCVRVYDPRLTMRIEFPVPYASSVAFAPRTKLLAIGSWQEGALVQV